MSCSINDLPPELLLEIFRFAMVFAAEPVNLSQVSYKWRCIALCTPTLWTNIKVEETLGPGLTFHRTCSRVKCHLDNSRQLPLTVEVTIHTFCKSICMEDSEHPFHQYAAEFSDATQALSRVLAEHVSRFKTFHLVADDFPSIADVQLHFPQACMPLLESWKVHQTFIEQAFVGSLEEPEDATKLLIPLRPQGLMEEHSVAMYPNLKVAVFEAIPMVWAYFCPRHLRTLDISFLPVDARPTMAELRQILMAIEHSLEEFVMQGAAPLDSSEPFEMRGVRLLTLGFVNAEELIPLLTTMNVPNLLMFSITDLRRACTSAADRPFVSYDPMMFELFIAILINLPLDKLDMLLLRCITFLPFADQPAFASPLLTWSGNKLDLPVPLLPLYFFSLMTSLKDLTLIDPDPTTMHCLNYLPKFNIDPSFLALPVNSLTSLRLISFNLPLIQLFFERRLQAHASFRLMKEIVISMPSNWRSKLRFNFSLIAKEVQIINLPVDQASERYLMRRLF
jgi:hypothetical protein